MNDKASMADRKKVANGGKAIFSLFFLLPLLSGCARQAADAVSHDPGTPGFLLGIWHGFIFPVAWVFSLFDAQIAIYAVPNTGGWYDFGYFLGIVFFGIGARKTKTVTIYVDRLRGR